MSMLAQSAAKPRTKNTEPKPDNKTSNKTILKKILFLTSEFPPQPGGIGVHSHQLASYLSNNYEVELLADQRSNKGDEESEFDTNQTFKVVRVFRFKLILFTYLQRIRLAFQKSKNSNLILVSGKFSLWVGGLLSVFSSKPIIAIIHGSEVLLSNSLAKKFTNWALSRFNHVIAVSHFTLGLVKELNLKSSSVIPNGFHSSEFDIVNWPTNNKTDNKNLQLVTVGNLTQRKGQHNVIAAIPELVKFYPNLLYHCIGIPTDRDKLENLTNTLKVENHVSFHGRLSEKAKFCVLKQADVFMMLSEQTSTGDVEGFGIAILEANALGLPAVGSLNCGIEDAIKNDFSGQLVNPHNLQDIVNAVHKVASTKEAYSKQAKQWSTNFTWEKIGKMYISKIETCVQ